MASNGIFGATIWSGIQRFGGLAISFISNMVLARLLNPDDFGIMGLIMVFITVADVLVDGGLGNALIQKKNIEEKDRTTIFTANLVFSLFLFVGLFILAPFIESFTEVSGFALLLRVQSICILIRAFYVVNVSQITRDLRFSKLAQITLISQILSTLVAIIMAYQGLGVWSLLLKTILLDLFCCILYAFASPFKYRFTFDKASFKELFNFGFPVALANIIESLYSNIVSFVIGKAYSVKDLGYFNQANSLKQIPVYSVSAVINQVFFPFFSKIQDDRIALMRQYRITVRVVTFFVYPILAFLILFAKPVIVLLYSEKWLPSVPLFQILCFSGFLNALYHLSRSTMKAIGKSKLLLYTQGTSLLLSLIFVYTFLQFSIQTFVWVIVIDAIISYSIVSYCIGKYLGYSLLRQICDWGVSFVIAMLVAYLTYILAQIIQMPMIIEIFIFFLINVTFFFMANIIIKNDIAAMVLNIIKSKLKLKKKHNV